MVSNEEVFSSWRARSTSGFSQTTEECCKICATAVNIGGRQITLNAALRRYTSFETVHLRTKTGMALYSQSFLSLLSSWARKPVSVFWSFLAKQAQRSSEFIKKIAVAFVYLLFRTSCLSTILTLQHSLLWLNSLGTGGNKSHPECVFNKPQLTGHLEYCQPDEPKWLPRQT